MPDPKLKVIGQGVDRPFENTPQEEAPASSAVNPVGKLRVVKQGVERPFAQYITDTGIPEQGPVNETDNFINRFGLAKDQIELAMYQGFKAQAQDSTGAMGDVWNKFLDNRIDTNKKDIEQQINNIQWTEDDKSPFKMSDVINRPMHFFSNQLPELLGQSIGSMAEPILTGAAAGGLVGSLVGPEGTVAGISAGTASGVAAGLTGMLTGRYLESMSEAGSAYEQAVQYLKAKNPNLTDKEIHEKGLSVMDDVFGKNMALGAADIPELLLAFTPMGRIASKLGGSKIGRYIGKNLVDRPYSSSLLTRNAGKIASGVKMAGVAGIEGAEEGAQHYIAESAQNKIRNTGDKKDLSLSGMWNDPEFQTSIQSGFLLGGLLGGVGKVSEKVLDSGKKLNSVDRDSQEEEQGNLKHDYIYKAAQDGRQSWLLGTIKDQGDLADGIFSDMSNKDEYTRIRDSKQVARDVHKDTEEKFTIYDAVHSNPKIKDDTHRVLAFQNEVNVRSLEKSIDRMSNSTSLNATEIAKSKVEIQRLNGVNKLIGEGKTISKNKDEFQAVEDKYKEKMAEFLPEPKPVVVKEEKKVASATETINKKSASVKTMITQKDRQDLTELGYDQVDIKNMKPADAGKIIKSKKVAPRKPVQKESGEIEPGFSFESNTDDGRAYHRVAKVTPAGYAVSDHPIDESGQRLQGRLNLYPKAEFESFVKAHASAKTADSIPQKDHPATFKAQKVVSEPSSDGSIASGDEKTNEQVSKELADKLAKKKAEQAEPIKTEFKTPTKEEAVKQDEEKKKDLVSKLKAKIDQIDRDLKSGANDITRAVPLHVAKIGLHAAVAGLELHGSIKRAIKEGVEAIKNHVWYKGLTKKNKRAAEAELMKHLTEDLGEELKSRKTAESDLGESQSDSVEDDADNVNDPFFDQLKEMGLQYEDNDDRARKVLNGIRAIYKDTPGVSEQSVLNNLYDLAHTGDFNDGDIRSEVEKLRNMPEGAAIADHLHHATDSELVRLFNSMKSMFRVPFIHHIQYAGTSGYRVGVSNNDKEAFIKTIDSVEEKLNDSKRGQALYFKYQTDLTKIINKYPKDGKKGYSAIAGNPKAKGEVFDLEIKFLKDLTGEDWNLWADTKLEKASPYKTYREYYVNTVRPDGKSYTLSESVIKKFLIGSSYSDLQKSLITKGGEGKSKFKSNISQLADVKNRLGVQKLGNYFDNIVNNRKSGFVLSSHAIFFANNIHKANREGYLKGNDLVDYFADKNEAAKVFVYDGIKNDQLGNKEETGSLSQNDLQLSILLNFTNPADLVESGEYLHPIEQLSDKKQTLFIQAVRYDLKSAKDRLAKLRGDAFGKELPSEKEINQEVKRMTEVVQKHIDNKAMSGSAPELAEQFVYNYILNKHFADLYFQGIPENYYKKGSFDYVTQVKRAGSFHSSGKVLNTKITGGIGEKARHLVLTDFEGTVEIKDGNGNVLHSFKDTDLADGQTFHTKDWDDRVRVSSGGEYGGIIKPIYSAVTKAGWRPLIKSNSILLTKEYVKGKPVLESLLKLMEDEKVDYVTVKSGVKHDSPESVTQFDWSTGKPAGEVHVNIRNNQNWRIQQDFTQNEAMDPKRLTKQMMRHFMDFKNSPKIQQLFNKSIKKETQKLVEEVSAKSPEEFAEFLLENIEDNDTNHQVRELIKSGASIDHPHLKNFIPIVYSSIATKRALDIKGNGAIYIETTSVGNDLKPYRIENGEVKPAEVLVPENSGLNVGDKIFSTRVPSSNHHSTSYAVVHGFTPKEMGNVIVMDPVSMKIAGADFDGDARHIWAPFKGKSGNAIAYKQGEDNSTKATMNEAFRLAEEEHLRLENFERIVAPINTDDLSDNLKKSDFKETIGNKHLLSTYLQMYKNNKDGKKVVGIVATSSKIFSFLRAHNASLKRSVFMPIIKDGGKVEDLELKDVKRDDKTKETIANNINQAVDAAKLQNLNAMGMTEFGASIYNMLEELGMPEESVINFFALKTVRDYLKRMDESKSVNSALGSFDVIDQMAKELHPDVEDQESKFPKYAKDVVLSRDDISEKTYQNKLNILQKLKYLVALSNDYFAFASVINATEKSPKTYAEFYKMMSDFEKIDTNSTHFSIDHDVDMDGKMLPSPYLIAAETALQTTEAFFNNKTIFGTKVGANIIKYFEGESSLKGVPKRLSNSQITSLSSALGNAAIAQGLRNDKPRTQVASDVKKSFADADKENLFVKQLEVDNYGQLAVRVDLRRIQSSIDDLEAIKEAFSELPESFKHDLMLYNFYEYGFSNSKKNGGSSLYFDNATHKKLSDIIESVGSSWEDGAPDNDVIREISKNNPELIPEVTLDWFANSKDGELYHITDGDKTKYPNYVKVKRGYVYKVFKRYKNPSTGDQYYKENSDLNFTVKPFVENKVYELPKKLQTSRPDSILASSDPDLFDFIKDRFKSLYPGVSIKFIENWLTTEGGQVLGAYANNTVFIDKSKAVQDTYFHEFAHGYWDALPDNDSVKQKLVEVFGDEEKAVQAIGEAGVDIAKVKLKGTTLARFKEILQAFWRKVKTAFNIADEKDLAKRMADRIWSNEDAVTFKSFGEDIIKYQLSDSVQAGQDFKVSELKRNVNKELNHLTSKDVEKIITNHGKTEEEIQQDLADRLNLHEDETLESLRSNPKEFFSRLAGTTSNVVMNKNEYSLAHQDFASAYSNLSNSDKKAVDEMYTRYLSDVDKIDKMWKQFKTVDAFYNTENITELRKMFNKLTAMDTIARGVLYDMVMNRIFHIRLTNQIRQENAEGFTGYKLATLALYELAHGIKTDFTSPLAKIMASAKDIADDKLLLQLHYKNIAIAQGEADRDFTSVGKKFDELEAAVKKDGGDLKNTVIVDERGGNQYVVFKSEDDKTLKPSERAYIEYAKRVQREWGKGGKIDQLPQIQSNFFDLYKKHGLWKAGQAAFFGSGSRDYITIKDQFGRFKTLKEAKDDIKLNEVSGFINKVQSVKILHGYEKQAEKLSKQKRHATGDIITDNDVRRISLNFEYIKNENASEDVNGVMKTFMQQLVFKTHMDPLLPTSVFVEKHYSGNSTKFVREWLTNFNNNVLFGRNPDSALGVYEKYVQQVINFTAWRYLALNPLGAVFNLTAGFTQSVRDRGLKTVLFAINRMRKNPRKFRAILRNMNVVSTSVDADLNQSTKQLKKFQNFMFGLITEAEYINQAYTYIGLMSDEEWNSYDENGDLISGKEGLSPERDVLLKEEVARTNGSYASVLRRPISYTTEGRAIMQFKGWLPDVFVTHFAKEFIDSNGIVRKGIVNTLFFTPELWKKVLKSKSLKDLSAVDRENLAKATRELVMSGMIMMWMCSIDDDDDDTNKALVAGLRRALGDITYVFDLDNIEFLLDSAVPALTTLVDLKKAFEDLFMGNSYVRANEYNEAGDLRFDDDIRKMLPGHKIVEDLLSGD